MNRLCEWVVICLYCVLCVVYFFHSFRSFIQSASQWVSYSTILSSVVSLSLTLRVWYIFFYCLFSYFSYVCVCASKRNIPYYGLFIKRSLYYFYIQNILNDRERERGIEKYYTSYVYALFDTKSIWNKYKWIKTLFLCVCACASEYYFWWTIDNENCVELRTMHSLISIAFIIMLCVYQLGRIFHWKAMTMTIPATSTTTTLKLLFAPSLSSTFESKLSLCDGVSLALSFSLTLFHSHAFDVCFCVCEYEPCLLMCLAGCLLLPLKLNSMR